jgi:hypothetical protein
MLTLYVQEQTVQLCRRFNYEFHIDERARELHWEGHRRTDLVCFGKFTGVIYGHGKVEFLRSANTIFRDLFLFQL